MSTTLVHRAQPTHAPTVGTRGWIALAVLMLPVLLVSVDNTVLSFALPSISASIGPTGAQQLWIVDVYPLVLAGLLVSMGSFGDRLGRRRLLLIGATGFAAVSALAAYAPTPEALIAARAALGFFGAMLMPSTLSLIRNIFLNPSQRRLAIAVWAACFAAGGALGPIVGGFLLEHFWWGSVFLLSVVVLIPLLILAPIFVPESKDPNPGPVDPTSILLSLFALAPLVYAVKNLAHGGPLGETVIPALVGAVASILFVRRQLLRDTPMIDVRLFRLPTFSGAVAVNLLSIFSLVGFLFFTSQHLQLVVGLSPMQAGVALLPGLGLTVVVGLAVVPLVRRIEPWLVVVVALCTSALGYLTVLAFASTDSIVPIIVAFALLGAGIGAAETISNDLIVSSVVPEKAGAASAVSETAYELGAVLGTAVLGSILMASYRAHLTVPAGVDAGAAHLAGETLGGAHHVAAGLPAAEGTALLDSAHAAFDAGVVLTSGIGAALMVVAAAVAYATLRVRD